MVRVAILLAIAFIVIAEYITTPRPVHPPSPVIAGIEFDFGSRREYAPGSDNWAVTWASDDHQYAVWGDGGGFGGTNENGRVSLGVARLEGPFEAVTGVNVWGGKNAERPARFTGKSVGIVAVDGRLYMWRNGDASNKSAFRFSRLYVSRDHARNWQSTSVEFDWRGTNAAKRLFAPTFLQFGRAYANARDDYVYVYAPEAFFQHWEVQYPGEISLMRVPRGRIARPGAYRFFAGFDDSGEPRWTPDIAARKPVFSDPANGVMRASVGYNPGIGRYLLTVQQVSRFRSRNGHIGIYDAPEPWGPWTTVLFENAWQTGLQAGEKTVLWNFSNKWLSPDGRDFVLVYTGPSADNLGMIRGSFTLR